MRVFRGIAQLLDVSDGNCSCGRGAPQDARCVRRTHRSHGPKAMRRMQPSDDGECQREQDSRSNDHQPTTVRLLPVVAGAKMSATALSEQHERANAATTTPTTTATVHPVLLTAQPVFPGRGLRQVLGGPRSVACDRRCCTRNALPTDTAHCLHQTQAMHQPNQAGSLHI